VCSAEVFVGEVGAGEEVGDLVDLFVDCVELLLEVGDLVLLNVLGLVLEDAEHAESGDLLIMGLDLDVDLLELLLEVLELITVPLHLADGDDQVIALGDHSVEGEGVDVLSEVLLVGDEREDGGVLILLFAFA